MTKPVLVVLGFGMLCLLLLGIYFYQGFREARAARREESAEADKRLQQLVWEARAERMLQEAAISVGMTLDD